MEYSIRLVYSFVSFNLIVLGQPALPEALSAHRGLTQDSWEPVAPDEQSGVPAAKPTPSSTPELPSEVTMRVSHGRCCDGYLTLDRNGITYKDDGIKPLPYGKHEFSCPWSHVTDAKFIDNTDGHDTKSSQLWFELTCTAFPNSRQSFVLMPFVERGYAPARKNFTLGQKVLGRWRK